MSGNQLSICLLCITRQAVSNMPGSERLTFTYIMSGKKTHHYALKFCWVSLQDLLSLCLSVHDVPSHAKSPHWGGRQTLQANNDYTFIIGSQCLAWLSKLTFSNLFHEASCGGDFPLSELATCTFPFSNYSFLLSSAAWLIRLAPCLFLDISSQIWVTHVAVFCIFIWRWPFFQLKSCEKGGTKTKKGTCPILKVGGGEGGLVVTDKPPPFPLPLDLLLSRWADATKWDAKREQESWAAISS